MRYWHPDEFKALEAAAYALGFEHIAAGPLVRSSYHADEHVAQERPAAARWPRRGQAARGGRRDSSRPHRHASTPRSRLDRRAASRAKALALDMGLPTHSVAPVAHPQLEPLARNDETC